MSAFVVTLTEFLDDYKARGKNWSSTEVRLFSTRQLAERFVCGVIARKLSQPWDVSAEEAALASNLPQDDLEAMWRFYEPLCEGEYVPQVWAYSIEEQVITCE